MPSVTTTHPRKAPMLRIALIAVGGLLALAAPRRRRPADPARASTRSSSRTR